MQLSTDKIGSGFGENPTIIRIGKDKFIKMNRLTNRIRNVHLSHDLFGFSFT